MKILAIGDIFGACGIEHTEAVLKGIIQDEQIDFCIANGENASGIGISRSDYDRLTDAGVDFFTLGNHTFGKKDVLKLFEQENNIIRPANYPDSVPGSGSSIVSVCGVKVGIINIMGRVNIDIALDCPFKTCDQEIEKLKEEVNQYSSFKSIIDILDLSVEELEPEKDLPELTDISEDDFAEENFNEAYNNWLKSLYN